MQQAFSAHHVESPEFMGIHYMDATTVEECWRLLRQTGKSNSYESLANLPRYTEWLKQQDWTDAYARHKENLQLVGLNDQDKRWVLKNPSHMTSLDALMTVYPDALIVYTHRDPVTCIASSCSLSAETTVGHSSTYVGGVIGHTQLDLWSRAFHAFHDARPAYDQDQFIDIAFQDLVTDPLGVTRRVYDQFGLDWTPEVQSAIEEIDQESKQGKAKPSHTYTLKDYGLTEDRVRAPSTDRTRCMRCKKRVVVWGTGVVGSMVIAEIVDHPVFELVGVGRLQPRQGRRRTPAPSAASRRPA